MVPQSKAIEGVKATHRALFNSQQSLRIFLVGTGGVGGELLDQIAHQQQFLAEKNIAIRVCGIANSKRLLLNVDGLDLTDWREKLANSNEHFSLHRFIDAVEDQHVLNLNFCRLHLQSRDCRQLFNFLEFRFPRGYA